MGQLSWLVPGYQGLCAFSLYETYMGNLTSNFTRASGKVAYLHFLTEKTVLWDSWPRPHSPHINFIGEQKCTPLSEERVPYTKNTVRQKDQRHTEYWPGCRYMERAEEHLFLVLHCLHYIYTCYQVSESLNGRYLQKKLIFLPFGFE